MTDRGEKTIAKQFYADSIKNPKWLIPIWLSRCHSGTVQATKITIWLQNEPQ